MKLSEISQMVSTLLADSSSNFFTESERLQAINTACSYVNSELRILINVAEIVVTVTNDGRIPLPSDFISIAKGIQWRDLRGTLTNLERAVPAQLQLTGKSEWGTDTGSPATYVMEGGNIYLTPKPIEAGTVILPYLAMPNKLLQDDDIPFYGDPRVQAYHEALAFYAAWMLTLKDRDFEAADKFMQYFQSRLIDLRENLRHTGDVGIQPVWADTYSSV